MNNTLLKESILDSAIKELETNIAAAKNNEMVDSSPLKGSGTMPFSGELDSNGNYSYTTTKYGAGITVSFTAWITDPNGTYHVVLTSSDGGGGTYDVVANQKISGKLSTSFWHNTKISVSIHSDTLRNVPFHGELNYSY